jgi:hypothetical protein
MTAILMPPATQTRQRALALGLLLLASAGTAAAWALVALAMDRQCGWMAVVAAVDAAWLLRLARSPRGASRALLAVAGTALAIVLANWWIAGAQIGQMVGLLPWESILRLGWSYAWTLSSLANGGAELAWYVAALALAAFAGR